MVDKEGIKQKIIDKAEKEPDFLAELVKFPKQTIHKYFTPPTGEQIPEWVTVKVVVDTEDTVYINVSAPDTARKDY